MESASAAAIRYELHLQSGQQGFQPGLYVRGVVALTGVTPTQAGGAALCCTVCHTTVPMTPFIATLWCRATWGVQATEHATQVRVGVGSQLMLCIAGAKVGVGFWVGLLVEMRVHSVAEGSCIM